MEPDPRHTPWLERYGLWDQGGGGGPTHDGYVASYDWPFYLFGADDSDDDDPGDLANGYYVHGQNHHVSWWFPLGDEGRAEAQGFRAALNWLVSYVNDEVDFLIDMAEGCPILEGQGWDEMDGRDLLVAADWIEDEVPARNGPAWKVSVAAWAARLRALGRRRFTHMP